ncbi:MAG: CPBP family intramembrane metalloprotease [Lachnospiraceae bacterium]|nr:CPBP family intramembrane metalloprotease [Lachnospiraceae bacterium]
MKEEKKFVIYMVIAFALAWILQFVGIVNAFSGRTIVYQGALAVSMFMPFVAVMIASKGIRKEKSGIEWGIHFKRNWKRILIAWFLPALATILGAVLYFLIFPEKFDINLGALAQTLKDNDVMVDTEGKVQGIPLSMLAIIQLISAVTYAPLINTFVAVGEEAGWRGYMTPVLSKWLGEGRALILSGIIWGIWHAPVIVFAGYEYGTGYKGEPVLGVLMMCGLTTSVGIILSYFYEKSQSIWLPSLMHGAINAVAGTPLFYMKEMPQHYLLGPTPAGLIGGIPLFVLGIVLFIKMTGKGQVSGAERS